jgi:hypothetical protein
MKAVYICNLYDCPKCGKPKQKHKQKYDERTLKWEFVTDKNGKCVLRR